VPLFTFSGHPSSCPLAVEVLIERSLPAFFSLRALTLDLTLFLPVVVVTTTPTSAELARSTRARGLGRDRLSATLTGPLGGFEGGVRNHPIALLDLFRPIFFPGTR
jgi:hypothetical protein